MPSWEETRERLRPYSWSLVIHCLLLAVLAFIRLGAIASPQPPLFLQVSLGSDDTAPALIELDGSLEALTPKPVDTSTVDHKPEPIELSLANVFNPTQEVQADTGERAAADEPTSGEGESGLSEGDAELAEEASRRVSARGGGIDAPVVVSLMWDGPNDIDLHIQYMQIKRTSAGERFGTTFHVYHGDPMMLPIAMLDVDSNSEGPKWAPCENIVGNPTPGHWQFTVAIHTFRVREPGPTDYVVVVKTGNRKRVFTGKLRQKDGHKEIITFRYTAE